MMEIFHLMLFLCQADVVGPLSSQPEWGWLLVLLVGHLGSRCLDLWANRIVCSLLGQSQPQETWLSHQQAGGGDAKSPSKILIGQSRRTSICNYAELSDLLKVRFFLLCSCQILYFL